MGAEQAQVIPPIRGEGKTVPFMSGQSGKIRPAFRASRSSRTAATRTSRPPPKAASSVNRWLPPPVSRPGTRAHQQVHEQADQGHRRGEVRRDGSPELPERTVSRPEPRLEADQQDRRDRRPEDGPRGRDGRAARAPPSQNQHPISAATERWIHSIQTWKPRPAGRNWPSKQPGQWGTPRPNPSRARPRRSRRARTRR